jgi:hypothetical protein
MEVRILGEGGTPSRRGTDRADGWQKNLTADLRGWTQIKTEEGTSVQKQLWPGLLLHDLQNQITLMSRTKTANGDYRSVAQDGSEL